MGTSNIEKKHFFIHGFGLLVVTFLVLLVLERSIAYAVRFSDDAQTGKVNLVMSRAIDPEIAIMGSSVAEVGFDAKLMEGNIGKSTYNLAIDGTSLPRSEYLLDNFLQHSKNCDVIVVGLAFFSLEEITDVHAPERFLAYKSNAYVKQNIKRTSPEFFKKIYRVPFYSFIAANHTYYKNAAIGFKRILNNETFLESESKGFVPHYTDYEDTRDASAPNQIEISEHTIIAYSRIVNKIRDKGIEPILVLTPMHQNGQKSFSNFDDFRLTLQKIAIDENVRFYDFSDHQLTTDTKYYYNNGHLNFKGSQVFTQAVCDSLHPFNGSLKTDQINP